MAVQFAHKPAGSIIGNGSHVFRHYGEEESLITFYVNPSSYYVSGIKFVCKAPADVSMTWYEWCNSKYNTDGFYCAGIYYNVYPPQSVGTMNNMYHDAAERTNIKGGDAIVANTTYYWGSD